MTSKEVESCDVVPHLSLSRVQQKSVWPKHGLFLTRSKISPYGLAEVVHFSHRHLPTPDFSQPPSSHRELLFTGDIVLVHKGYVAEEGPGARPLSPQPLVTPAKLQIKHLPAPAVFQGQAYSPAPGRAFTSMGTQAKPRGSIELCESFCIYSLGLWKFACFFRQGKRSSP